MNDEITLVVDESTTNVNLRVPGIQGPPGAGIVVYDFNTPAATWTVNHNLGRYVQTHVIVTDSGVTSEWDSDVEYPNLNQVVVTHCRPLPGHVVVT